MPECSGKIIFRNMNFQNNNDSVKITEVVET